MTVLTFPRAELRSRLASATAASHNMARESSSLAALRHPRQLRTEVFAGLVTALALIPETISFSILAGVGPAVGLFTSFIFAMTIAVVGGRPAMISAAAGSIALVVAPLVRDHGVEYLIAAVILGGLLQIALALCGVAKLMRFIPHSVLTGFVNALAILIFASQLPHLVGVPWLVYPMVVSALLVMIVLPRITRTVPAPLVATAALTVVAIVLALDVPRVGDEGSLASMPHFGLPDIAFGVDTLLIIAPYACAIALVGLLESLITAQIVDEFTGTASNKNREGRGQGMANIVVGLWGGMGGCAMIGQTMMNVKGCGGRTRISTFVAGATLLCSVAFFSSTLAAIPMAALVAVMIAVSVTTMDWTSIAPRTLRRMPIGESLTMVTSVVVTIVTHNLAYGVIVGVLCSMALFVRRVAGGTHVVLEPTSAALAAEGDPDHPDRKPEHLTYRVVGQLFFASSRSLHDRFNYTADPPHVTIDFSDAHLWDATSVAALDAIRERYRRSGTTVAFTGFNESSAALHSRLTEAVDVTD